MCGEDLVVNCETWFSCDCCAMGVKASFTLGREEKPWGEGVSWSSTSSRENSSMCGEDLVVICEH